MTFDFALWGEGKVPVTIVCEEAHRYVPANPALGFEPCKRAIAKIAKEGRKYGASLAIVTQRPAEIDPTILSQCNTVFALRMSNDRDQEIVKSAISDTGSGLLEFLSALGQREAIAFGDGVTLPVRIRFDDLPKHAMPRSSSAMFTTMWQQPSTDTGFLEQIVEKWRLSVSGSAATETSQTALFADAMGLTNSAEPAQAPRPAAPATPADPAARRYPTPAGAEGASQRPRVPEPAGYSQVAPAGAAPQQPAQASNALRNLRDRLNRSGR